MCLLYRFLFRFRLMVKISIQVVLIVNGERRLCLCETGQGNMKVELIWTKTMTDLVHIGMLLLCFLMMMKMIFNLLKATSERNIFTKDECGVRLFKKANRLLLIYFTTKSNLILQNKFTQNHSKWQDISNLQPRMSIYIIILSANVQPNAMISLSITVTHHMNR